MVDRTRLVALVVVVAVGGGLLALGSGPVSTDGTVATNQPPGANVTVAEGATDPGTVTVRFTSTGDWSTAALTVAWNDSLRVADGERRLEEPGEAVTLADRNAAGETPVRVTVTATGGGRARTIYRETVRL
jgi:hypothetical protein